MINAKMFDTNKVKIDEKSCKDILIYYIGYVMFKDLRYIQNNSVNPLCLITDKLMVNTLKKSMEVNI